MGFRYRRSVKVLPGVRLNLNKSGHSWTVGGKYARTTINKKRGTVTRSVRAPVKGLYYSDTSKIGKQEGKPSNTKRLVRDGRVSYFENPTSSRIMYKIAVICIYFIMVVATLGLALPFGVAGLIVMAPIDWVLYRIARLYRETYIRMK